MCPKVAEEQIKGENASSICYHQTRFLPTDHRDTASDDTRRDPSHAPLDWKFCTMNMTAFSTQHFAIFELGCHVCGLQETRLTEAQVWARELMREQNWSIVFGQPLAALRSAWEARGQNQGLEHH